MIRPALTLAAAALVLTGCGPNPIPGAPAAPPPPSIGWVRIGDLPSPSNGAVWTACVPVPGKGYSEQLYATDVGGSPGRSGVLTAAGRC